MGKMESVARIAPFQSMCKRAEKIQVKNKMLFKNKVDQAQPTCGNPKIYNIEKKV